MKNESSVYNYSTPVHKVLFSADLLFGIGIIPAMIILIVTVVLMNFVSGWCVFIGVLLLMVAKLLTKKDPYQLTILFDRILNHPSMWSV